MNLPGSFLRTIEQTFGQRGRDFLETLPERIDEAVRLWQLSAVEPVSNLSYNYVAFAERLERPVVLKIGVPDPELLSEMISLRLFEGRGTVRLLESDEVRSMFLLERLQPGEMLATLEDDDRATELAGQLMRALWRTDVSDPRLIRLSDWFKGLARLRQHFDGGTGPFPSGLVEQAEAIAAEFLAEPNPETLIHGDLHHFNILSSKRGWVAIDPKGVLGPSAYEVGPFLLNPWVVSGLEPDVPRLTERRIAILSSVLGFEKERLRRWGLAYAVLSAWWNLEAGEDWGTAMACADILSAIEP